MTRPFSRAVTRRFDDDWFLDDWPARKVRKVSPRYDDTPVVLMNEMNRQMAEAVNRMQEFAEDLDALDSLVSRSWDQDDLRPTKSKKLANREMMKRTESGGLQLALDVAGFKPEELKIKLVDDNLVVEALSESSGENSYQRSHFKRWFKLPEGCKLEEIKSKLTSDSRLLIDLPTNKQIEQNQARSIPIEMEKSDKKQVENKEKPAAEEKK